MKQFIKTVKLDIKPYTFGHHGLMTILMICLFCRGFQMLLLHRTGAGLVGKQFLWRFCPAIEWLIGFLFACEIRCSAELGTGLLFPHPTGIVIGEGAVVEDNVTIYQNVTLGARGGLGKNKLQYPSIASNVIVYANSVIAGGIRVGANAIIGASALVLEDVPSGGYAFGLKATIKQMSVN